MWRIIHKSTFHRPFELQGGKCRTQNKMSDKSGEILSGGTGKMGRRLTAAGLHSYGVDMWTKKQAMGTIEKNPKSKFIGVRLTADEYETLRARMSEDGYLAISRFVLDCTIRRRSTGRPVKAEEYADLVASIKKSTSAINKWGSLYNQTVKALNSIAAGVPANEVPKILTLMEKQKRLAALVRADQERINDAVEKMLSIAK